MNVFELDTKLMPVVNEWERKQSLCDHGARKFLTAVETVPEQLRSVKGFIDYVCFCYKNHYSMAIAPTDIMYMVQCELAMAIKNAPDAFSSMFTTTPDTKQEILVPTANVESIKPELVIAALQHRVPTKVDLFLPEFSTDTRNSTMASHVAFCDMVSPYYNYGTFLCGIPRVEVMGTIEDWQKLGKTLFDLATLFQGDLRAYLGEVWARVALIIKECTTGNGDMFKTIVSMKECGSGSDQYVTGWITDFLNMSKKQKQHLMLKNVHQHISTMMYKNVETQRKFNLYAGIFYAIVSRDVATVEYNSYRNEIIDIATGK